MRTLVGRSVSWFVAFALTVIIVLLLIVTWQVDRRTDSIATINESAQRIEEAAVHTEQVLLEVVEASETPEAVAQQQAVRDALGQIRQIHDLLCSVEQFVDAAECADG